jgi:hypothetical protein
MSAIKGMVAAVAMLAVTWPTAAEACTLAKLVGVWTLRVVETDIVYPDGRDYFEETSHISCTLRITRKGAPAGEALATATACTASPYSAGIARPDERFEIYRNRDQPRCEWWLSSVTKEPFHTSLPGDSVNGTGDGSNLLTFDRHGEVLIGAGNLPLGFAGGDPDSKHWMGFQVTLFGLKK